MRADCHPDCRVSSSISDFDSRDGRSGAESLAEILPRLLERYGLTEEAAGRSGNAAAAESELELVA